MKNTVWVKVVKDFMFLEDDFFYQVNVGSILNVIDMEEYWKVLFIKGNVPSHYLTFTDENKQNITTTRIILTFKQFIYKNLNMMKNGDVFDINFKFDLDTQSNGMNYLNIFLEQYTKYVERISKDGTEVNG